MLYVGNNSPNKIYLGNEEIHSIYRGNNLIWGGLAVQYMVWFNQLINKPDIISASRVTDNEDGTYTINGLTSSGTTNITFSVEMVTNHLYAIKIVEDDFPFTMSSSGLRITPSFTTSSYFSGKGWVLKRYTGTSGVVTFRFSTSSSTSVLVYPFDIHPMVIDLTAMFGEGYEPTLAEFKELYPLYNYFYCAGEYRKAPNNRETAYKDLRANYGSGTEFSYNSY